MDIIKHIQFPAAVVAVTKLDGYGSINYKVSLADDTRYLVKISDTKNKKIIRETERILSALKVCTIQFPVPVMFPLEKDILESAYITVSTFIDGVALDRSLATDAVLADISQAAAEMLAALQHIESDVIKANEHDWNLRDALRNKSKIQYITDASGRRVVMHYFSVFEHEVLPTFPFLRRSIIHGDLNEANIIIKDDTVQGFIDFGDISYAPDVCELAILLTYIMMMFPEECFQKARIIIENFQKKFPLTEEEIEMLPNLVATRLCVSVCNSAEAKSTQNDTDYILISEKPAWRLLHKWAATNPVFITNLFKKFAGYSVADPDSVSLLERRKKVASPSLSLSYHAPIYMTSALFQYMYDASGGSYLDAYNNIPHVGHCHPAIVEAATRQTRKLNTNTRYLYDSYVDYSEKLLSLFPQSLDKVMLVNSGSEASDLATRMARTVTGKPAIAVLQWSYHGNTQNGINISSYKFDRKGGAGPKDTILRLPLPKEYHGRCATAAAYFSEAKTLIEKFEDEMNPLAAFIAEPISGCGGQVPLMDGYLSLLVPYLKRKGILVIIDEVQTGFGRLGQWFWGFEMHGIVPDMVVLGKPIANGHPMGAVVTTNAITGAFNNGMEFFSSFGGNPVSCEIGNAVIETIQQESLQQNALEVGKYWMQELNMLRDRFPLLGDVRGAGLFIGVECIDENGKENTALAQQIKNGLKDAYILSSTDGPLDNVLKMKPPLCFNKENVDTFMNALIILLKKSGQ